jgi:polyhydroxybutyrate depolymerase
VIRLLLTLAVLGWGVAAGAETLLHDGRERSYILDAPEGIALPAPAVFVLHGGSRSAAKIRRSTRFHQHGAANGHVTVYPDGVGNQWNDDRDADAVRGNQGGEDVDDVGFLVALAGRLAREGIADPARIYVTGSSNGGMMAFRLACEAADVFAAFAPVIASLPARAEESCRPSRPVPLMMINGAEDRLIPWEGGEVAAMFPGDRGAVLSVDRTVSIFRRLNGCGAPEIVNDRSPDDYGTPLFITRATGCEGFSEVVLYRFEGMGHRWPEPRVLRLPPRWQALLGRAPDGFPARDHIWRFFRDHRLRG